jgi:PAS domain S-box-containing protein
MAELLRALIIEDSEQDAFFLVRELRKGGFDPKVAQAGTEEELAAELAAGTWDVILSDYKVPGFGGPEALSLLQKKKLDIPFIVVSGAIGEETAVQMMKAGAHDYVMKDKLTRLPGAVRRELGAAQERRKRREAEAETARLAAIVAHCGDAVIGEDLNGIVTSWNGGAEHLFGHAAADMVGRSSSVLLPQSLPGEMPSINSLLRHGARIEDFETVRVRKDGVEVEVSLTVSPIRDEAGRVVGVSVIARDISRRKQEERERTRLIEKLRDSLAHVKTLSGLLPICCACKRIRDDAGYWQAVETYIRQHTEAELTHSLCDECVRRLYPDIAEELLEKKPGV